MSKISYIGRQQRGRIGKTKIVEEPKFVILMDISRRFSGYPEKVEIIRGKDRFEYLNGFFNKRSLKVPERSLDINFSVHEKGYSVLARRYANITSDAYLAKMNAKDNKKKGVKKTAIISTYTLEVSAESMLNNMSILVNIDYNGYSEDKGKRVEDVIYTVDTFYDYSDSKSKNKSHSKMVDMNGYLTSTKNINLTVILIATMKAMKLSFTSTKSTSVKVAVMARLAKGRKIEERTYLEGYTTKDIKNLYYYLLSKYGDKAQARIFHTEVIHDAYSRHVEESYLEDIFPENNRYTKKTDFSGNIVIDDDKINKFYYIYAYIYISMILTGNVHIDLEDEKRSFTRKDLAEYVKDVYSFAISRYIENMYVVKEDESSSESSSY